MFWKESKSLTKRTNRSAFHYKWATGSGFPERPHNRNIVVAIARHNLTHNKKHEEANMMTHSGYLQFAEALVFAQGSNAEAEAAKTCHSV